MNQLQVLLLDKASSTSRSRRHLIIDVSEAENVSSLKEKIAAASGVPSKELNIIFSGRSLSVEIPLRSLRLGQSTSLVATVSSKPVAVPQASSPTKANGSFFVYCKKCAQVRQGKLRVYCSSCKSTAVLLQALPKSRDDVFDAAPAVVDCQNCETARNAQIVFKCADCHEEAPALRHVKRNRYHRECMICSSIEAQLIVSLRCQHVACLECFVAYMDCSLSQWLMIHKPTVGFTVSCPMFECPAFVEDAHHFHMLGLDKYRHFQRTAAERFLSLEHERQYCPYPNCGAAFTVELFENEKHVCCPECGRLYCPNCQGTSRCKCHEPPDPSDCLIKAISKKCPSCGVPTERDGGCSHINCSRCRFDWCFICMKEWSSDCQWDHWFD